MESAEGNTAGRENRWVLGIPVLLLLELFAEVLLTTDTWAWAVAVTVVFPLPEDADLLLLGVAMLLARGEVGGVGRVLRLRLSVRLTTLPPGPVVMGKVELDLLVGCGGGGRALLLGVTVGGGEDAEGDGDSRFKIQVDCLGWARRVVSSSTSGQG